MTSSADEVINEIRNKPGHDTNILGQWITRFLTDSLQYNRYRVFYDHGDSAIENVAAIKGFVGSEVANVNRIADIDIMIVDSEDRVILLIELEERGSSPKKILGDVFAILMCNGFAVRKDGKQHYFKLTSESRLIVSGILPDSGKRIIKIKDTIKPRLRLLNGFEDGIHPSKVDLVFHSTIEATVRALQVSISEQLPT